MDWPKIECWRLIMFHYLPLLPHYRVGLEHDVMRLCAKLAIPLVPYRKDQTLDATNWSLMTSLDCHSAPGQPPLSYNWRTVFGYENEMSVPGIIAAATFPTILKHVLTPQQQPLVALVPGPPPGPDVIAAIALLLWGNPSLPLNTINRPRTKPGFAIWKEFSRHPHKVVPP